MKHLIDKDALVAEIEEWLTEVEKLSRSKEARDEYGKGYCSGRKDSYRKILHVINTLEVKEVDLKKELIEWHKEHFKKDGTFIGNSGFYLTNNSQMDIAKHFFELGLKAAQKGEEV